MATKHSQPDDCLTFLEQANSSSGKKIVARFGNTLEHGSLDEFLNIFTRYFFYSCSTLSLMGRVFTEIQFKNKVGSSFSFGVESNVFVPIIRCDSSLKANAQFLPFGTIY